MNFYDKYLKYKNKYFNLKNQYGSSQKAKQGDNTKVYTVLGHGCTLNQKLRVPKGCQYVTLVPIGTSSDASAMNNIIFENAFQKNHELLKNPKANIAELKKLLNYATISVHYYTENKSDITGSYYNAEYRPFQKWDTNNKSDILLSKKDNSILYAASSGMHILGSKINNFVGNIKKNNIAYTINHIFNESIYPSKRDVFRVYRESNKIDDIGAKFKIDQNTLFKKYPGVHFNFVCRDKCNKDLTQKVIELRRQNSYDSSIEEIARYRHDPIHIECYKNNLETLKKIVSKKNINLRDIDGNTPFMIIFNQINNDFDSTEIITFLLSKNPDLTITNYKFQNILHLLNEHNIDNKYITLIINHAPNIINELLNKPDLIDNTPLMTSIINRYINVTKFLLLKKCDINCFNNSILPSLHLLLNDKLLTEDNIELLKQLITPENINQRIENINVNGVTPLLIASADFNKDIISLLIEKGAKENDKDNYENTPLLITLNYSKTKNRNIDLAKYFINNNKYIHDCNVFGDNILIKACMEKENDIINLLLEKTDIDLLHKNKYGYCALSYLNDNNVIANNLLNKIIERYDIVKYSEFRFKDIETNKEYSILSFACKLKNYLVIFTIIDKDHSLTNDGEPLLHFAIKENNIAMINFLLCKNQNIDINSMYNGNTTLHLAVKNNNIEIVRLLCNNQNINLNLVNSEEDSVLDIACINRDDSILKILISSNKRKRIKQDNYINCLESYLEKNKINFSDTNLRIV
jgi:ankyrin repeat protein